MLTLTVLTGTDAGVSVRFHGDLTAIGRDPNNDLILTDRNVSRSHCQITRQGEFYFVKDVGSKRGTLVNGSRVAEQQLNPGDELSLGNVRIRVELTQAVLLEETNTVQPTNELGTRLSAKSREVAPHVSPPPEIEKSPLEAIRPPDADILLEIVSGLDAQKQPYKPSQEVISIGRSPTCTIVLHDPEVSRLHATIRYSVGQYWLFDEGSTNGTSLRSPDEQISHAVLRSDDFIYLGQTQIRVIIPSDIASDVEAQKQEGVTLSGTVEGKSHSFNLPATSSATGVRPAHEEQRAERSNDELQEGQAQLPSTPIGDKLDQQPSQASEETAQVSSPPPVDDTAQQAGKSGVPVRPFTMPGSLRHLAALIVMVVAAASSLGFLSFGGPLSPSSGPIHDKHAKYENQCATCHPSWNSESINATCGQANCHVNFVNANNKTKDDCVSCHGEHRGREFNMVGGEARCWQCHEDGLQVRRFLARPVRAFYEQLFVEAKPVSLKGETTASPFILQLPATEEKYRAWRESLPQSTNSGLKFGHIAHEKDVIKAYEETVRQTTPEPIPPKGVACIDCHTEFAENVADDEKHRFPTHAECIGCHKEAVDKNPEVAKNSSGNQCLKCHSQQDGGITQVERSINYITFSHNSLGHGQIACKRCHFTVLGETTYQPVLRSAAVYPLPMDVCYTCHEQRLAMFQAKNEEERKSKALGCAASCHSIHHNYPYAVRPTEQSLSVHWALGGLTFLLIGVLGYTIVDVKRTNKWLALFPPKPEEKHDRVSTQAPHTSGSESGKKSQSSDSTQPSGGDDNVLPFPMLITSNCTSCKQCYDNCPTHVLAPDAQGHSTIINADACDAKKGCRVCQDKCHFSAIFVTKLKKVQRAAINEDNESNIPGLFLIGAIVGANRLKPAANQGDRVVRHIHYNKPHLADAPYDIIIVGAGPGGLGAALEAKELGLRALVLERYTVANILQEYDRGKDITVDPVYQRLYSYLPIKPVSREDLINTWKEAAQRVGLEIHEQTEVTGIEKNSEGWFTISTSQKTYQAGYVILAIGAGSPRKLSVLGEELPKVFYQLGDPADLRGKKVLVVGGGNSAIEAIRALVEEDGITITLSYRGEKYKGLATSNAQDIERLQAEKRVTVIFNSNVTEIRERSVFLKVGQDIREVENDAVVILIGRDLPNAWLEKLGVNITEVDELPGG